MVIPLGHGRGDQELVRIRRSDDGGTLTREELGAVRFVPLVGEGGWAPEDGRGGGPSRSGPSRAAAARTGTRGHPPAGPVGLISRAAEPLGDPDTDDLGPLLERIGEARLVLLGEASHGTSDFYSLRARITRELIEKRGFDFVAVEADWPDAAEIDAWVRHHPEERPRHKPFQRFPRWMWANTDVMDFAHWLRDFNGVVADTEPGRMVGFHGLDLYSMYTSIEVVLRYLDEIDPEAAVVARERYRCLSPWQSDPVLYGRAVLQGVFDECEDDVLAILRDLMDKRLDYVRRDGQRFVDAVQNARLVANAERYYRVMYRGSVSSWNLRDQHMFDTLELLLGVHGPESRGVVWAHNSHLGDASATAMGERGEHNVGQLVRQRFGPQAYLVGFGTHTGTVAAASDWGAPMEVKRVRPSHPRSYEFLCHDTEIPRFLLPLDAARHPELVRRLSDRRLERAIGVIYRPETELQSHYFHAALPRQFDEWIWLDETAAVTPVTGEILEAVHPDGVPDTYPFGL
jgi:protein-L-isoaspartate(D-aspartate) O-methyltransferase